VLAALAHGLTVRALPRLAMQRVLDAERPGRIEAGVFLPPMTDHHSRRIVMPSPDLLYASCTFDVSTKALRIRAAPDAPGYWSIAPYAANSDNFFVLNDRQAAGGGTQLVCAPSAPASRRRAAR
jgi:uncharacterized membrane protein